MQEMFTPILGIFTTYPWYIDPLTMLFSPPYAWYFHPSSHGISNPLPMVF